MIRLEGGCRVAGLKDGTPLREGTLSVWAHFSRGVGAEAISLRVLEFSPGLSPGLRNESSDEVLYVLAGEGVAFLDGRPRRLVPDTGFYLRPGVCLTVENAGPEPLTLVSSRCPDPGSALGMTSPCTVPGKYGRPFESLPFVHSSERQAESTGDRWYRVLVDERVGSTQVTQFVGAIPPGRAPDHFHQYEEVLCILGGTGRMWAGKSQTGIEAGSCIFLPRGQVHCVENTGCGELRLLGVFYPAGSPAVRYKPHD